MSEAKEEIVYARWPTIIKSLEKKGIERFCPKFASGIVQIRSKIGKVLYRRGVYIDGMIDSSQEITIGKIDIHRTKEKYVVALESLKKDTSISDHNRELILSFLRDAEMGKTIKQGQKRKLGINRRLKYIATLKIFARWAKKDLDKVTSDDMEKIIFDLENDQIKAKKGKAYSEETKADIKRLLKKFYKWLLGNNETYPDCVSWFDTSVKEKEIPSLTREEVEKLIEGSARFANKVIIMVLFDSGARIEEFLNLRLKHVTKREDYYLLRIEYSKTKPRTISVPLCTPLLGDWLKKFDTNNPDAPLFPFSYDSVRMILKRAGRRVLKKAVYPHLLRHSSATYYANIEKNYFRFCKRYGWTFGSSMAQRYIDRAGVDEEITAKAVQGDEISKVRIENIRLKEDMNRLQAQLGQLDKINLVLDDAFRNYPQFREIITTVARRKVLENKI